MGDGPSGPRDAVDEHGNFLNADGSIAFISGKFFSEKILENGHCFICGRSPQEANFNEEHIIPQWLLTHADIWDTEITLPNGRRLNYGRYKVSCCITCNSQMGNVFERKIAPIVRAGAAAVESFVQTEDGYRLIFTWLALLHLKTSVRDFSLRYHADKRLPSFQIGDTLDQRLLHHVHCLCRAFVGRSDIDEQVFGSLLVFEMEQSVLTEDKFNFADFHYPQTVLVRVGNVALMSCLNDSGTLISILGNHLDRVRVWGKPLNDLQLKETFAHLTCASIQMKKPTFLTLFDRTSRKTSMRCNRSDEVEIADFDPRVMGGILLTQLRPFLPSLVINRKIGVGAARLVASGGVTFYSGEFAKISDGSLDFGEGFENEIEEILADCLLGLTPEPH